MLRSGDERKPAELKLRPALPNRTDTLEALCAHPGLAARAAVGRPRPPAPAPTTLPRPGKGGTRSHKHRNTGTLPKPRAQNSVCPHSACFCRL